MHVDQLITLRSMVERLHAYLLAEELLPPWASHRDAIEFADEIAAWLDRKAAEAPI